MRRLSRHYQRRYGINDASVIGRSGDLPDAVECNLSGPLSVLSDVLEQANALGLYNNETVLQAQRTYEAYQTSGIPNCSQAASAINSAANQVGAIVAGAMPAGGFHIGPDLPALNSLSPLEIGLLVGGAIAGVGIIWWASR